ncbi:MAG: PorT family protein [Bacteroidales bacterium]|nr:PorT family protein [Bacteroidales bacterium]
MKKKILAIVLAAMSLALTVGAQPRMGVLAGFTSSKASVSEFEASSVSLYHAGVAFNFPLGVGFAVQPQLTYQVKGTSLDQIHSLADVSAQDMNLKVGYVEIPVQIQYGVDLMAFRPYVFAEPFIGFGINMTSKYSADDSVLEKLTNEFKDADLRRFEYGLGFGAGIDVWRLQLSAKYFWNFGKLSADGGTVDSQYIGETVRTAFREKKNFNGLAVSLAYFF